MARQRARHLRYELEQDCKKADVEAAAFAKEAREEHVNNLMEISHEHDETTAKNFDNRRAYEQQTKELMVVSAIRITDVSQSRISLRIRIRINFIYPRASWISFA